jgi:hypothetical protein
MSPLAMNWSVGVTTSARRDPTLARTLESLAIAGFPLPRLFADGPTDIPPAYGHLAASHRDERIGAFPNWYLGLTEMLMRAPEADAYIMCQDDVVFCRGLGRYLEHAVPAVLATGIVSLFCPSHFGRGHEAPGFHVEDRGWDTWGALALVFSRETLESLLSDCGVLAHRRSGPSGGMRNIDSVIGAWCRASGRHYFVHAPSLAQHIGKTSTLHLGAGMFGNRVAADFIGESADPVELFCVR